MRTSASSPETFAFTHDEAQWNAEIDQVYGTLSAEVKALQKKVGFYTDQRLKIIRSKWSEIRQILQEAPCRHEMEQLLSRAGYEMEDFITFYGEEVIRTCIRSSKDLKDRYTLLWLLNDTGLLKNFSRDIKLTVG
jgi:glycerol-1-phosphate dehydrogenase [NAD(P)+]